MASEQRSPRSSGAAAPAALPSRLCSSSRGTAHATNFGSLAPTHDFPEPQEVARIFHQAFSSTSTRTVISPPLLLSSGSHPNRLFTRMYTVHRDCIIDPRSQLTIAKVQRGEKAWEGGKITAKRTPAAAALCVVHTGAVAERHRSRHSAPANGGCWDQPATN